MESHGIKDGEWYIESKPSVRRAATNRFISPAGRMYAFLSLATAGYQSELALKMEAGQKVPLTPGDVCAATGIRREHFRRHMDELEAYGLAECIGNTKGRIEIYRWLVPREVSKEKIVAARGDNLTVACDDGEPVAAELIAALKRYRIRGSFVAARGDIVEIERMALATKEAELSLRTRVEGCRARPASEPAIRKKGTERNIKADAVPFPAPEPLYVETISSSSVSSEPTTTKVPAYIKVTTPQADAGAILLEMAEYNLGDMDAAGKLIKDVHAIAPDATTADICRVIHEKAPLTLRNGKGTGYLCASVRNAFTGPWRAPAPAVSAETLTDEEIARAKELTDQAFAAEMSKPLK